MSYCTQSDLLEQISEGKLIGLTDDNDTGIVDADVVARAIADADAEIDGYCGTRYAVPFIAVPEIIRKVSVDIAIYNLYARKKGVSDTRQKRYENAVKILTNVSRALISLGADDPDSTPAANNTPQISSNDRIFTRDKMSGY